DRLLQRNHIQERREQAADLAASTLQRVLAEAEERLASFSTDPGAARRDFKDGVALIAFGREGMLDHAGIPLPYYPVLSKSPEPDPTRFTEADELEFQKKDLAGALRALNAMARGKDTLLRIARIQKKLGSTSD